MRRGASKAESPRPPDSSRQSPQAGLAGCSSTSCAFDGSRTSRQTDNPIYYSANFTIRRTESMFLAPIIWLFLIPTHFVNIECFLLSYDALSWFRKTYSRDYMFTLVVNNSLSWFSSTGMYTGHTVLNHCVQNLHYFAVF